MIDKLDISDFPNLAFIELNNQVLVNDLICNHDNLKQIKSYMNADKNYPDVSNLQVSPNNKNLKIVIIMDKEIKIYKNIKPY